MDYPRSRLTKPIRRVIFIFFITMFLLVAPMIILYTSGYRYDWRYGLLKETGAINIDVQPKNAAIYVNDIKINSKMPVRLKNRVPNKYNIRITAPGYYDWQKNVEVKSKQTVYIKDIYLLKKNEPSMLVEGDINSTALAYDGQYLSYITKQNNLTEVWLKNLRIPQADQILLRLSGKQDLKMLWTDTNHFLAISNTDPPYNILYLVDADRPNKQFNLIDKIKYPIEQYQWKDSGEAELFYATKLKIMSILPKTKQQFILGDNKYIDWRMENGRLWTIEMASGTSKIKIIKDALGFKSDFLEEDILLPPEQKIRFIALQGGRALLKKTGLSEMIIATKDKKFNIAGEKFSSSRYNNWWIIWTPWEIWTHSQNEEPYLLNRSGEQLQKIVPLDRYNTLALIWSDKTTVLYPYYLVSHGLLNYQIKEATADSKKRIFYFIAEINNQKGLWQLSY